MLPFFPPFPELLLLLSCTETTILSFTLFEKKWVFFLSLRTCQQSLSPLQLSVPVLQWASATETEHSNRRAAAKARRRPEGSTRSTEKEGIRIPVHNFLACDYEKETHVIFVFSPPVLAPPAPATNMFP